MVVAPARAAIARSASGGMILSCLATMYQLGIVFQAGSSDGVPNAASARVAARRRAKAASRAGHVLGEQRRKAAGSM